MYPAPDGIGKVMEGVMIVVWSWASVAGTASFMNGTWTVEDLLFLPGSVLLTVVFLQLQLARFGRHTLDSLDRLIGQVLGVVTVFVGFLLFLTRAAVEALA